MKKTQFLLRHAGLDPASRCMPTVGQEAGPRLKAGVTVGLLAALILAVPATGQTQTDLNARAGNQLRAADATMTAQWKRTYAYMKRRDGQDNSPGGGFSYAAALLESQRAWLKFRDTECVIEGGEFAGGSLQPMVRGNCLTRLTRERTKQLKDLVWKQP